MSDHLKGCLYTDLPIITPSKSQSASNDSSIFLKPPFISINNSGSNSSYANKSSGAEGWEDRSYGNSSENDAYENGRSRRKGGVSNESNASKETN